jgi:hypothetical protein
MCAYELKGRCQAGDSCCFAHSADELHILPNFRKTKLCTAFSDGCCFETDCPFAHGAEELRTTQQFFKTKLCAWNEKGLCRNGDACRFAHHISELKKDAVRPKLQPTLRQKPDPLPPAKSSAANEFWKVAPLYSGNTIPQYDAMRHEDMPSTASGSRSSEGSDRGSPSSKGNDCGADQSAEVERLKDELYSLSARFMQLEQQLHENTSETQVPYEPCFIDIAATYTQNYASSNLESYGCAFNQDETWPVFMPDADATSEAVAVAQTHAMERVFSEISASSQLTYAPEAVSSDLFTQEPHARETVLTF